MSNSNFVKIRTFPTPNAMAPNNLLKSDLGLGLGLVENFGCTLPTGSTSNTYFVTNGTSNDTALIVGVNYNDVAAQFIVPNILCSVRSVILNTPNSGNLPPSNSFVNIVVTTIGVPTPTVYNFPYNSGSTYPLIYNLTNSTSLPIKLQIGQTVTVNYTSATGTTSTVPTMVSLYIE